MMFEMIPQELHERLLDLENYQNRTNGVEILKKILSDLDLKAVSSDSMVEFIHFLHRLLDDTNFKVLYGTLQVMSLLIEKLDYSVEKYLKQIVCAALKTLGDTRAFTRNEYMNVFRQLMRIVGPPQVLELVMGHLSHKNSRVREDVLNIITTAVLTYPRRDFNIPSLCLEVAPYLADSKKNVRHAALELFAVFDYCLDTDKKQPLLRAIDRVELDREAEGLMAAVQARRARRLLPRLSSDGMVEYALVIPGPGQRRPPELGLGADLEWVLSGGRVRSGSSSRGLSGSEGSLTDNFPLHRRIASACKGKYKLPWERMSLPAAVNPKASEQVSDQEGLSPASEPGREARVPSSDSTEYHQPLLSRRRESLRASQKRGSVELDPLALESASPWDCERVPTKSGCPLRGHRSVERTFSLPSNPTPQGGLLLPSYPLASIPGRQLSPTALRGHANSTLSMSSTWPYKRESSPRGRDPSPRRDTPGGDVSMLTMRASLRPSSTAPSRRSLSGSRLVPPIPRGSHCPSEQSRSGRDVPRSEPLAERSLHLNLAQLDLLDQDQELIDRKEMMNSLRSLRISAARKRAKLSLSGSDPEPEPEPEPEPDSPDSAVKLELLMDSPSHTSPSVTSPLSESGLSSLYSPPNSTLSGTKASFGNSSSPPLRPGRMKVAAPMDSHPIHGIQPGDRGASDVSVVGQRLAYSNGSTEQEENTPREASPPPPRLPGREPMRALRLGRGSQGNGTRDSPARGMSEGVVGRGVFGSSTPLSSRLGVAPSPEHGEVTCQPPADPPAGVYGHAVPGGFHGASGSPETEEQVDKVKLSKSARDKMRQRRLEQQEVRQSLRQVASEIVADGMTRVKDWQVNGSMVGKDKVESFPEGPQAGPLSPPSPQGPATPPQVSSPPHLPRPPCQPRLLKASVTRLRRAGSLNKPRPSLCHSSDELSPEEGQNKDAQRQPGLRPFSRPEMALTQSFQLLSSDDWEKKIDGLTNLRCLAQFHSNVLLTRLHDVCLALAQEVKNLRSGVSRIALGAVGDLYTHLQKGMDQELEATAKVLLQKAGDSNAFIRQDVDGALDSMVQHCSPTRVINALLDGGLSHLNSGVRKCTAQHLADLVEKVGAGRLLSGPKDLTDRILPAVAKLAQDSSQETRYFGRRMLLSLASHQDFEKMAEKYLPAKDLATVLALKAKGLGETPQDAPSARGRPSLPGRASVRASSLTREPVSQASRDPREFSGRAQVHNMADKAEYVKQMTALMASKDFRERIKGIDQLVAVCERNPGVVITSLFQVFDPIKDRLLESNSKVNLHALEALQKIIPQLKDNMAQVLCFLVPAIVDNHLNSKNNAIYNAAIGSVHALMQNIDKTLLIQPFCTKAQFLKGKAKVDLVEKVADLVTELHPHKPQTVENNALPLLWHLLGPSSSSGTVQGATAALCQALYASMGPALADSASTQSLNVHKGLQKLLKTLPSP